MPIRSTNLLLQIDSLNLKIAVSHRELQKYQFS